jgi:hypothetical protein
MNITTSPLPCPSEDAVAFLRAAAAAGTPRLPAHLAAIAPLREAHGHDALGAAMRCRAVQFRRLTADETTVFPWACTERPPMPHRTPCPRVGDDRQRPVPVLRQDLQRFRFQTSPFRCRWLRTSGPCLGVDGSWAPPDHNVTRRTPPSVWPPPSPWRHPLGLRPLSPVPSRLRLASAARRQLCSASRRRWIVRVRAEGVWSQTPSGRGRADEVPDDALALRHPRNGWCR